MKLSDILLFPLVFRSLTRIEGGVQRYHILRRIVPQVRMDSPTFYDVDVTELFEVFVVYSA